MKNQRYIEKDTYILTPGVNWGYGQGSVLNLIEPGEFYQVWHKPTTQDWCGRGELSQTFPSTYWLVSVCNSRVRKVIEEVEPGYRWASCKQRLKMKCDRLNRLAQIVASKEQS